MSQFLEPLCFQAWNLSTNLLTYVLDRRPTQEHITPTGHT